MLIGYGSIITTGIYANKAHKDLDNLEVVQDATKRYFKPGVNWPERMIFLIPVFGIPLLSLDGAKNNLLDAWVLIAAAMWIITVYLSIAKFWRSEKAVQNILLQKDQIKFRSQLEGHLKRLSFLSIWIGAMALIGVLVMFIKPS